LIPCVNGANIDNEFRHTRIVSLYAMINLLMRGGDYSEFSKSNHRDKSFTKKLGLANLENAISFLIDNRVNK
jgi:hypothetical protein